MEKQKERKKFQLCNCYMIEDGNGNGGHMVVTSNKIE